MDPTVGSYRYRIKSTRESSVKYGKCEVCKKHASEVFHQVEERAFRLDDIDYEKYPALRLPAGEVRWTHNKCHNLFGHKECLVKKRRNPIYEVREG